MPCSQIQSAIRVGTRPQKIKERRNRCRAESVGHEPALLNGQNNTKWYEASRVGSRTAADTRVLGPARPGPARPGLDLVGGMSGRRPSTIAGYRHPINHDALLAVGRVDLQALTALHLDRLYAELLGRGLAMSTVRKVHAVVGKASSDAERKGFANRNVARLATPPAHSASRAPEMKFWTPEQLHSFLTSIVGHHEYPLIRLAALRWSDVDLRKAMVSVRQSTTVVDGKPITGDVKTKRSRRVIDIDAVTVATLKSRAQTQKEYALLHGAGWNGSGLVFTMPAGEAWHPDSISQAFDRLESPASKARAERC